MNNDRPDYPNCPMTAEVIRGVKERQREWDRENPEKRRLNSKRWTEKNPERRRELNRRSYERRSKICGYRVTSRLRSRLWYALKKTGSQKSAKTMELTGLESGYDIVDYLFTKSPWFDRDEFQGLEVDHIIPCAVFNLDDKEHQKVCFHFTNLQLLEPWVNREKWDKVLPGFDIDSHVQNQIELIKKIEADNLSFYDVLENGNLFEVKGVEVKGQKTK